MIRGMTGPKEHHLGPEVCQFTRRGKRESSVLAKLGMEGFKEGSKIAPRGVDLMNKGLKAAKVRRQGLPPMMACIRAMKALEDPADQQ